MKTSARKTRRHRLLAAAQAACMAAALSLGYGQTFAVGRLVYDPTSHRSSVADMYRQYLQTVKQYTQDAEAYLRQYQHMQQQLTQLNQIFRLGDLLMTKNMSERSLSYGIEVCGKTSPLSLTSMFELIRIDLNGNIVDQQQSKCQQIIRLHNMKYNEYVRLLKNLEKRADEISKLEKQVATSNTNGKLDTNIAQAQSIIGKTLADSQYSMSIINVYDGMIETLRQDQRNLGERAMKGSQDTLEGLTGTLVQGATLKVALDTLRAKDR
jgi:hypothetical protein